MASEASQESLNTSGTLTPMRSPSKVRFEDPLSDRDDLFGGKQRCLERPASAASTTEDAVAATATSPEDAAASPGGSREE